MPAVSPLGNTGGGLYTGLTRGGIGFAFAAAASSTGGGGGGGGSGGGATTSMGGSGGGGRGGGAGTSGSGSGSPSAAFVAGRSDSGSGDRNLRTDPRSSPSGAPSAAPWRGADTRGAIGAWSPTGAPNVNGAPLAAPSEAGADVGGTVDGLTIPDEEDGAERSGERSRTSYDSGSTSYTS